MEEQTEPTMCRECKFYVVTEDAEVGDGECHRFAPHPYPRGMFREDETSYFTFWPEVDSTTPSCGQGMRW